MNPRSLLSLGPVKSSTFFLKIKTKVLPFFKHNSTYNAHSSLQSKTGAWRHRWNGKK